MDWSSIQPIWSLYITIIKTTALYNPYGVELYIRTRSLYNTLYKH